MSRRRALGFAALASLLVSSGALAASVPFDTASTLGSVAGATSVVAGDLDRDGDLDLLVGGHSAGVRWLANDGSDGPWTPGTIDASFNVRHLALGDLDGDGDLDAIGGQASDPLTWWRNDGAVAWSGTELDTTAPGTKFLDSYGVAAGDLDGDGDLDIVAANGSLAWFENTAGDGTAWTYHDFASSASVSQVLRPAVADFDGDGDLDVVTAGGDGEGSVCWYENDGAATSWVRQTIVAGLTYRAASVSVGDADFDGAPDVLVSIGSDDSADGELAWFEADGTRHDLDTTFFRTQWSELADLDGDGDLDAVATSWTDGGTPGALVWWQNFGSGAFGSGTTIGEVGSGMEGAVADLDGDGDADVLAARFSNGDVVGFENRTLHRSARYNLDPAVAAPAHRTVVSSTRTDVQFLRAGDLDCDGDADLVVASSSDPDYLEWWENPVLGGGGWASHTITTTLGDPRGGLELVDLDRDGDLDLVIGGGGELRWAKNLGCAAGWSFFSHSFAGYTLTQLAAGDIDRDGDVDLAVAMFDDGNPTASEQVWLESDGADPIGWTEHPIAGSLSIDGSSQGALADLDGDGDLDRIGTAFLSSSPGRLGIWLLDDGALVADASVFTQDTLRSVAAADFDGDGDVDLAAIAIAGDDVLWWQNDGTGAGWSQHTIQLNSVAYGWDLLAADLDGDGDADVVGSDDEGDRVRFWENLGGGVFASARSIAISFDGARGIAAADLDRDGDLDVAAVAAGASTLAWHENRGGQIAFPATDAVVGPTAVEGDDDVLLLRIDATHRGRAGDEDAEIVSLRLSFRDNITALSSAELNALLDAIRIYRDTGNGTFEPGLDSILVQATAPFAVVGGGLALTAADGDPNAQLAHGTPATSWLAVDLDPGAASAPKSTFNVALSSSASLFAEMRSNDLPLRIEHQEQTVSSNVQVLARRTLTVVVDGTGSGNVTSSPGAIDCGSLGSVCADDFGDSTVVTLTPAAGTGSTFDGWSGGGCASGTVTMNADRTCTATFTLDTHTLTVGVTGDGDVTSSPAGIDCGSSNSDCDQTYDYGTEVTLTPQPVPTSGYEFTGWSGDGDCSDGVVTMTADLACDATFELGARTLDVTVVGTGTVTSSAGGVNCTGAGGDCSEAYVYGTNATLTPSAGLGWSFDGWSGDPDCADGAVSMTADHACTATFTEDPAPEYTLTVAIVGEGDVTSEPAGIACDDLGGDCEQVYAADTVVALSAEPALGWTFAGWSGDADCGDGSVTMSGSRSCTATFTTDLVFADDFEAGTLAAWSASVGGP